MKPTESKRRFGHWLDPRGKAQRRIVRHQERRAREAEARSRSREFD